MYEREPSVMFIMVTFIIPSPSPTSVMLTGSGVRKTGRFKLIRSPLLLKVPSKGPTTKFPVKQTNTYENG